MILYKSLCRDSRTFHGVTFHYGEIKAVNGYIHDRRFVCIGKVQPKSDTDTKDVVAESEKTKVIETKATSDRTKSKVKTKTESKSATEFDSADDQVVEDKKKPRTRTRTKSRQETSTEKTQSEEKD